MRADRRGRWPARVALLLGAGLLATYAPSASAKERPRPSEPEEPAVDPIERVARREVLLTERASEAALRARQSALTAYRLSRRSSVRFLVAPETRGKDARARAAALLILRRHVQEASALERERSQSSAERAALERAAGLPPASAPVLGDANDFDPEMTEEPADEDEGPDGPELAGRLVRPARAPVVARPGLRRDPATTALHRLTGLEYLHRLNQPVRATAAGTVRRVEALPQGGFAVLLEHASDRNLVSVVTGLRRVDVAPGQPVKRRQTLGICGRNLDGAPMVGFELWHAGAPLDPGPLLDERPGHPKGKRESRRAALRRRESPSATGGSKVGP